MDYFFVRIVVKNFKHALRQPAALTLSLLLVACGGGGGGSPTPTPTPTPTPEPVCSLAITADATIETAQTGGATVIPTNCGTRQMSTIVWSQVSGPAVSLPAARQPTVAFEAAQTGTVRLRADVVFTDGSSANASSDVVITTPVPGSQVTVRVDHSVRAGTDTSVRAWPQLVAGETLTSLTWTQVAGPTVAPTVQDPRVLMVKAPAVTVPTALKYRVTMVTSSGRTDTDDVLITVDPQPAVVNDYIFERTARVHPYVSTGAYASVLARCVYDNQMFYVSSSNQNLCSVATLPLLQANADASGLPSVASVMARVLVSHDFLGANFENFLLTQDPHGDFRRMLAGTTAIVLGSHVRPSFYSAASGAIYLDANFLWLTPDQRDVVTEVPDYRAAFAEKVNFTGVGRLVKNNNYARFGYSSTARITRTQPDLVLGLGRLLYHELAHASDYFAPAERALNPSVGIWLNVVDRLSAKTLPSDALSVQFPLTSMEWKGLGQVLYQGKDPTTAESTYTAAQVGAFFGSDVASDDYAYSSVREDLAMLFEEFMLAHRHGVQYDVGYTNLYRDGMTSDQLIVAWGQRGRIGSPAIKPRVKLVLARIAPWIPASAVDALPAPIQMVPGRSWDSTLVLSASSKMMPSSILSSMSTAQRVEQTRDDVMSRKHAH